MTMADADVRIVGVDALVGDLQRMANPGGALDDASTRAATDVLRPRAATTQAAIPKVSGAMAATVAVQAEPFGAALSEGDGIAYAGWVDFGGNRPQSGPRPYLPQGRYLFPSAANLEPAAVAALDQSLQTALDRYGWTNQGNTAGAVHG